jgi:hypothetical protein
MLGFFIVLSLLFSILLEDVIRNPIDRSSQFSATRVRWRIGSGVSNGGSRFLRDRLVTVLVPHQRFVIATPSRD